MSEAPAQPPGAEPPPGPVSEPELLVSSTIGGGGRLLVFRAVQFAFLFLLSLIATRALGPSGRGQYALALNLATVVWVVSHLSVEQSVARMLARGDATAVELCHLSSAFSLVLGAIGMAITLAIGLPARGALLGDASPATVALAAATIPFTLIGQMATALLLRMGGALRTYGWIIAIGAAVQFALVLGLETGIGLTPALAMTAAAVTIALVAIALALALARRVGLRALTPMTEWRLVRSALGIGLRLQPASIALWLNLKIDLLLVGLLVTARQAGLYSLSANLAEIVFIAISTVALAALEAQTRADTKAALAYTLDFIGQSLAIAVALALSAALIAYPFVVLVYGSVWAGSVVPFVILMPAVLALAIEGPSREMLIRVASPLVISVASGAGLALNVGLNLVLIPAIGIAGASIASVASYWLAGGLMLRILSRHGEVPMRRALRLPRRDDALPLLLRRRLRGACG